MEFIERETKLVLDASDFRTLRSHGEVRSVTRQLNIYYDDRDALSRRGMTFRIRQRSDGPPVLTLKTRVSEDGAYRESREHEEPLRPAPGWRAAARPLRISVERDLPAAYARLILPLGLTELRRLGWLRNDRAVVRIPEGELELDRLTLPDGAVVHEAEIEEDDPAAHRRLVEAVMAIAPSARPSTTGKFGRFRRSMRAARR
jgi:inorganic triphosphatase YgiF